MDQILMVASLKLDIRAVDQAVINNSINSISLPKNNK